MDQPNVLIQQQRLADAMYGKGKILVERCGNSFAWQPIGDDWWAGKPSAPLICSLVQAHAVTDEQIERMELANSGLSTVP